MRKQSKDYYAEIDKALQSYENYRAWHDKSIDWIIDRIEWCHKWRKITEQQTEELANRVCAYLEGEF